MEWVGEPYNVTAKRSYYNKVLINGEEVDCMSICADVIVKYNNLCLVLKVVVGDTVSVCPEDPHVPLYTARIIFMWENSMGMKKFHAHWFRYHCYLLTAFVTLLP